MDDQSFERAPSERVSALPRGSVDSATVADRFTPDGGGICDPVVVVDTDTLAGAGVPNFSGTGLRAVGGSGFAEAARRMEIVIAYPPLFDLIDAKFHVRGKPVYYCWDRFIFNPMNVPLTMPLVAHETIHCKQQAGVPEEWWKAYIADDKFRFEHELFAHQAEYAVYCAKVKDRNMRARMLHVIAQRLSGPLYGGMADFATARRRIQEFARHG